MNLRKLSKIIVLAVIVSATSCAYHQGMNAQMRQQDRYRDDLDILGRESDVGLSDQKALRSERERLRRSISKLKNDRRRIRGNDVSDRSRRAELTAEINRLEKRLNSIEL